MKIFVVIFVKFDNTTQYIDLSEILFVSETS